MPKQIHLPKIYDDNQDNNKEQIFIYCENNKLNLYNSKTNDNEDTKNTLNSTRGYQNKDGHDHDHIYNKLNKKYDKLILHNIHKKRKNNLLPGDFVPRIKENDNSSQHVRIVPSSEQSTKTIIHTLENSFHSSFKEDSFCKLKHASLLDNPKYAYLKDNYNNVKVHKSNLFSKNKNKDKKK